MTIRAFEGIFPRIDATAFIDETALVIGRVSVGAESSLWPMVVARGDVNSISIGARTNIQDACVLHVTHDGPNLRGGAPLAVGDGVTVGHQAVLHGCTIGDHCLVGIGSTVLDRAEIPPYTIIGAGGLVPGGRRLEGGCLYVGAPVRRVRELTPEEHSMLEYSAAHYVKLMEQHRAGG